MSETVQIEVPNGVLDAWQDIVDILSGILGISAALIMRYSDPSIEVFVASRNKSNPYRPRDKENLYGSGLYCEKVIRTREKLLVPDALADKEWKSNPDIKFGMISYLGFPILLPDQSPFGTLCILDNKRNAYSEITEKLMLKFRGLIESHLEILYLNQALGDKNKQLKDYMLEIQTLRGLIPICANCKSIRDEKGVWRPIEHYLARYPETDFTHGICPACAEKFYPEFKKKSDRH